VAVAEALLKMLDGTKSAFKPLYDAKLSIKDKIDTIARKIYGADGVRYSPGAERALELIPALGLS